MRTTWLAALAVAIALAASAACAQTSRTPARMLSGSPPGGNVDILARIFAEKLAESIGRPVVVDTRPGASGQIAAEALKAAAADGNTLLLAPDANIIIRPQTLKNPPFNPLTDFIAVAQTGNSAYALGITASIPAKDLREFVSWAKANPGSASFASAGPGGATHFLGLMLGQAAGVELRHVPYKGVGPAVADVAAGHIPAATLPLGTLLAQARAGKIRLLAVSGAGRSPVVPEVPTFAELGYAPVQAEGWFGIFAPAGTPPETVQRLNAVFVQAMRTQDIRDRLSRLNLEVRAMTPAEFEAVLKSDYQRWGAVIRASGFTAEDQ